MVVSVIALIVSGASLCLAMVFIVRQKEYSLKIALRLNRHEDMLHIHDRELAGKYSLGKLCKIVDAHIHADSSEAKLIGCALADRIDALSARLDAAELACGLREKPKTMGGS